MTSFADRVTDPNYLNAKGQFQDIPNKVVYVEDRSDIHMWKMFIEYFFPNEYLFTPARTDEGDYYEGKPALIKLFHKANKNALFAIDSDYDYIISQFQENHFLNNPYILHTFAFSKESVFMDKIKLQDVFKKSFYNIEHDINITDVLTTLSPLIYDNLIKYIYIIKEKNFSPVMVEKKGSLYKLFHQCFICADLKRFVKREDKSVILDIPSLFSIMQTKTQETFKDFSFTDEGIKEIQNGLLQCGITPQNAYRFISGHIMFDLIEGIYKRMISNLKSLEKSSIYKQKQSDLDRENRINQLENSLNNFNLHMYIHMQDIWETDEIHQKICQKIQAIP